MALPRNINASNPASSASPGDGDDELRSLKQDLLDLFGLPSATNITGAILSLGALVDGKVATDTVVKADTPFKRLIGTESSARDVRVVETAGDVRLQRNTNTEASPTWANDVQLSSAGIALHAQVFG